MSSVMSVFPGQGSAYVGMGKSFCDNSKDAYQIFEEGSDIIHRDIRKICFESDIETLASTENAQIAIYTLSLAIYKVLEKEGFYSTSVAGFSLGELTALSIAGSFSIEDGFRIVEERGRLMKEISESVSGRMCAVIGLPDNVVEEVCAAVNGYVAPVNYNCPLQIVISGEPGSCDSAAEILKSKGAKRVLTLPVSGAFHTKLVIDAANKLEGYLSNINHSNPKINFYSNLNGDIIKDFNLKSHIKNHMISPVKWSSLIDNAIKNNNQTFVEIGCGKTLTGFIKRINKDVNVFNIEEYGDLAKLNDILKK